MYFSRILPGGLVHEHQRWPPHERHGGAQLAPVSPAQFGAAGAGVRREVQGGQRGGDGLRKKESSYSYLGKQGVRVMNPTPPLASGSHCSHV